MTVEKDFLSSVQRETGKIAYSLRVQCACALCVLPDTGRAFIFGERDTSMRQKAQIMDEAALGRALMRISHEITEKNRG